MKSYQELFAELKRRHVFRVAAIYGGVGFVVLQVADVLGQGLLLPEWFLPLVTALVLLGFPIALIVAWAFELTPGGVRRTGAAGPGEIESIAEEPAARRWSAGLIALLGGGALLLGAWWVGTQTGFPEARSEDAEPNAAVTLLPGDDTDADTRPSIAVLPFDDLSPESDQAYFSDGITEELLSTLTRVAGLRVAARTSALAFRDTDIDMRTIGDSLDVSYLIEGSVRKADDRLRITAQLIDAADGSSVWSEAYNRQLDDVFQIQIEIAEAIAERLRAPLGLDRPEALVRPTADLEAYDLYLEGRARIRERGESLRDAVQLFEAALAQDSSWAPAWAALAEARELQSWYPESWDREPATPEATREIWTELQAAAETAALRALALDPDLPSARVALGSVYWARTEWDAAEREYRRALAIDPDNAEAHQQYADLLSASGRIREARTQIERAMRLDPAPIRLRQYSGILWADSRYSESLEVARRVIDADPDGPHSEALRQLYYIHAMQIGEYDEALRYGLDAWEGATLDDHAQLVRALESGDPALVPDGPLGDHSVLLALTWQRFGDPDIAVENIRRAIPENRLINPVWFWHEVFDPIRQRPDVQELLAPFDLDGRTVERTPRSDEPGSTS